jgi:DNA-binding response OmpR family regulator
MSIRSSGEEDSAGSRLGGARADFVASLGRKVRDARELLSALEDDPSSRQARDELRRRLHALGAGARLLRFEAMFRSLQEALGVLDRAAHAGILREQEVAFVVEVVDDLTALAWGEAQPPPALREPPDVLSEPPRVASEPPPALREPPRALSEPPQVTSERPSALSEHPRALREPPQAVSEHPRALREPPQAMREPAHAVSEPPQAMREPAQAVREPPGASTETEDGGRADPGAALIEEAPSGLMPIAVLIVGDEALADALADGAALRPRAFESERTEDARTALELARAYAPDVMLVDADLPYAGDLIEALLEDPLTEPVPIVVVGSFGTADDAARFVALGVAKALPKPIAPEVLAQTCDEILEVPGSRALRVTLGEPTLEQLADRLSGELKRALLDGVDRTARASRVPLGEGTEVLGALWGAIARVQAIVSQKTGGAVRFAGAAPEGTVALAPWLHQELTSAAASDRAGARGRGAAADVRLRGRRVVVADDDPGVTWFISDLLRTAGCEVHEALDGTTALALAYRIQPELVVSDILMPGMDGFALSRALRRDVALRDVPVILLSWKEDLLQRVRELGANAAGYMRKESDSRSILARVRELLRPRARIEMRLRGGGEGGEVRGRLDGLTARLLLELVGAMRKDARVAVRDATYLYEIEIRGGVPRKATRTASDGGYLRGERVLASLLGVGAGRFVVSPGAGSIRGDLSGTLFDQLAHPVAAARGAVAASTGARMVNVERIALDEASLDDYLRATPDPARGIVQRLVAGGSPRQMLVAGEVSPTLLEDVLVDLASRGAIRAVEGPRGVDWLTPAVEAALAVLRETPIPVRSRPPDGPVTPRSGEPVAPFTIRPRAEVPAEGRPEAWRSPLADLVADLATAPREVPPARVPAAPGEGPPSSLEDAVMREISDRSPEPGSAHVPPSDPPPLIEPSALRKRSSNPPAHDDGTVDAVEEWVPLSSLPPDAMVPGTSSSDEPFLAAPSASRSLAAHHHAPLPSEPELEPARGVDRLTDPEPEPLSDLPREEPALEPDARPEPEHEAEVDTPYASPFAVANDAAALPAPPSPPLLEPALFAPPAPFPTPDPTIAPAPAAPRKAPRSPWSFVAFAAVLGLAVGALLHLRSGPTDRALAAPPTPTTSERLPVPPASPAPAALPAASTAASDPGDAFSPADELPQGFGRIEVSAPEGASVRIDGAIAGAGPTAILVAAPGVHEVRVELADAGPETSEVIEVRAGETTRVRSAPSP